jgi:spermidine/putrescine transport system permease protein
MVMPIYMTLERLDWNLILAARSLGASRWYTFRRIVLPLSLPGVIAGVIFVFMPVAGTFVVPELVGGTKGLMIGKVIASQFGTASNWALGSALAAILLIVLLLALGLLTRLRERMAGEYH